MGAGVALASAWLQGNPEGLSIRKSLVNWANVVFARPQKCYNGGDLSIRRGRRPAGHWEKCNERITKRSYGSHRFG